MALNSQDLLFKLLLSGSERRMMNNYSRNTDINQAYPEWNINFSSN